MDFDDAAVEVAKQMAWMPALNRDRATPVWLVQEVTFAAGQPLVGGGTRLHLRLAVTSQESPRRGLGLTADLPITTLICPACTPNRPFVSRCN